MQLARREGTETSLETSKKGVGEKNPSVTDPTDATIKVITGTAGGVTDPARDSGNRKRSKA